MKALMVYLSSGKEITLVRGTEDQLDADEDRVRKSFEVGPTLIEFECDGVHYHLLADSIIGWSRIVG